MEDAPVESPRDLQTPCKQQSPEVIKQFKQHKLIEQITDNFQERRKIAQERYFFYQRKFEAQQLNQSPFPHKI